MDGRRSPATRARELVDTLRVDAAETDREGGFPSHSIDALRTTGLLAAAVPAARGGESLGDADRGVELLETLAAVGRGSLVAGRLLEGHVNALLLVERHGDEDQRARAAADALAGRLFAVWNTEAADGVTLRRAGAGFVLDGAKTFASGLGHVARAVVTATVAASGPDAPPRGPQMLVLSLDEQGAREDRSFWRPLGMRASASFRADFGGRRVAARELLGAPGDYYAQPAFGGGAVRFAAVQLGGAEALFDETRRFLRALGRSEDPFQRARLGEMAWRIESGRHWLRAAGERVVPALAAASVDGDGASDSDSSSYGEGDSDSFGGGDSNSYGDSDGDGDGAPERILAYAHMTRSAIEEECLRVSELAVRSVGARGLLKPEPFERLYRDLVHYLRQPAPDAALAEIGRHVLGRTLPADALWR